MPKSKIIAQWIEMSQGYMYDGPPKKTTYEAVLFINRCELRERASGERRLHRHTGCEFISAVDKAGMEDKIGSFMLREDVRLLAKGLDANNFRILPAEDKDPAQSVIDGTDEEIYMLVEEPNTSTPAQ